MKKNPIQTNETRDKLKAAFWTLYAQKPIDKIAVREITALAGYNRSTFYMYYKDVYDVLEQTVEEIFKAIQDKKHFFKDPFDSDAFEQSMQYFVSVFEEYREYLLLLFGEKGDHKFWLRLWKQLREEIRVGLAHKSALDPCTLDYVTDFILNAQIGQLMSWFRRGCDLPLEDFARLARRLTHNGVDSVLCVKLTADSAQDRKIREQVCSGADGCVR